MYNEKFDEAIKAFTDFRDSKQKLSKEFTPAERLIEMCGNGKLHVASPVNVTFTNLGKTINTIYEEYNPFISADGKQLVFTSRRKGNVGGFIADLGIYTADIYSSFWRDTIWTKAKGAGGMVNTEWDEEAVGLSATGDLVFIYFDNAEFYGDVGASMLKGKMWQRPAMMPTNLNSKSLEGGVTLSLDGTTMIFSSDVKGSLGETDLYMIKKEKNGEWSTAVNLGSTINTKYAEDYPYLTIDGKSLYFASKGWSSMGGFDIFRSDWNESTSSWGEAKNIGYPLNDMDDNTFISFTGDGKTAYMSTVRPEGLGDKDI
ncbi:MAG: PD40 domain-containing protein [Bacteroidetes bacterium]|nr:PD40 domain-containing protein [Bacteroidota bacterium]